MIAQVNDGSQIVSDWIPVAELAKLTKRELKSLYNDHSARRGPFAKILVKLGGRLGCWRADYEALKAQQRRLPPDGADQAPPEQITPSASAGGSKPAHARRANLAALSAAKVGRLR
ncbi:MAG: hypothetical protein JWO52_2558 [Gammaproteobacteria bacterium]|nr:hypothetical protein [Gammaproteobacteria bacterium]